MMKRVVGLTMGLALLSCVAEAGTIFDFSYTGDSHEASGTLIANDNGDGSFTAISGLGQYDGVSISLMANPAAPNTAISPSGYFYFDNQLFPAGNPLILNGGLLFAINYAGATELNIYSNGPYPANQYTSYLNNGVADNGVFTLTQEPPVSFSAVSGVPEPMTIPLVIGGMLALAVLRCFRPAAARSAYSQTTGRSREESAQ
jgi:hypothetical protein